MSISIIFKRKTSRNFTIIPNDVINDSRLSWKSLGILVKLLSLPPNYSYLTMESLSKKNGTGAAATRSGLQELEDAGYLSIQRKHDARGRFAHTVWTISDTSDRKTEMSPFCGNPNMDSPPMENPSVESAPLINTKNTTKQKNKKTTTALYQNTTSESPPLRLTALVSAETRGQIFKALEQVAPSDQQRMLDELSTAIRAGTIKTTAVRWFHGVIKRYRDGSYIFRSQPFEQVSEPYQERPVDDPSSDPKFSPSSVTSEMKSNVGTEYLRQLKLNRRCSNSLNSQALTDEGLEKP